MSHPTVGLRLNSFLRSLRAKKGLEAGGGGELGMARGADLQAKENARDEGVGGEALGHLRARVDVKVRLQLADDGGVPDGRATKQIALRRNTRAPHLVPASNPVSCHLTR